MPGIGAFALESVLEGSLAVSGLFFVWAGLVALLTWQGQRPEPEALAATVRTLAFAAVPFGWSFLIFVPGIEYPVTLIALGLLLLSTTLATQTAVGGSLGRSWWGSSSGWGAERADEPGGSVRRRCSSGSGSACSGREGAAGRRLGRGRGGVSWSSR